MRHVAAALALVLVALLAAPAARAGNGADLLGLVPADASMVASIDLADVRDAPLAQQVLDALLARVPDAGQLASAGLDPKTDVDTLLLAVHQDAAGATVIDAVILEGGFAKGALAKLATTHASVVKRRHRGVTYYELGTLEAAQIGRRILLASDGGAPALIDLARARTTRQRRASVAGAPRAAALRAIIADTDTRHDLWVAMIPPADVVQSSASMGFALAGLSVAASLGAGVALEVRAQLGDAATVTRLVDLLGQQLSSLQQAASGAGLSATVNSLEIEGEGDRLELRATIPEAEVATLTMLLQLI